MNKLLLTTILIATLPAFLYPGLEDFQGLGPQDRVKAARYYIGTEYKQQSEWDFPGMRTGFTKEALKYMDCSELVSRVLEADWVTYNVESLDSYQMKCMLDNEFPRENPFIHSDIPQVGDIALWEGHVGIVSEVGKNNTFKLIHAAGEKKGVMENPWITTAAKYRSSKFHGFYRPAEESPEGKDIKPIIKK